MELSFFSLRGSASAIQKRSNLTFCQQIELWDRKPAFLLVTQYDSVFASYRPQRYKSSQVIIKLSQTLSLSVKNAGLFSTLFLDEIQAALASSDDAQGRLVTLKQSWRRRDAASTDTLWRSFIKTALGNLGFVVKTSRSPAVSMRCLRTSVSRTASRFSTPSSRARTWTTNRSADSGLRNSLPALRDRKLNWGILTDGAKWRLYSTKSAKPYEDHVELDLERCARTAPTKPITRCSSVSSTPIHLCRANRTITTTDKVVQLKELGLKARKQKRQEAASDGEDTETPRAKLLAHAEREAGIYLCRLDLDGEISEAILEAQTLKSRFWRRWTTCSATSAMALLRTLHAPVPPTQRRNGAKFSRVR